MKKHIFVLFVIIILCFSLSGCANVVKEEAVDVTFSEAHTEVSYIWHKVGGVTVMQPIYHKIPDKYYIVYKVYYDNGKTKLRQRETTKEQYNKFLEEHK